MQVQLHAGASRAINVLIVQSSEEPRAPAVLGLERGPDDLGAFAHILQPPVLKLDTSHAVADGRKLHLDLWEEISIELPICANSPGENES